MQGPDPVRTNVWVGPELYFGERPRFKKEKSSFSLSKSLISLFLFLSRGFVRGFGEEEACLVEKLSLVQED